MLRTSQLFNYEKLISTIFFLLPVSIILLQIHTKYRKRNDIKLNNKNHAIIKFVSQKVSIRITILSMLGFNVANCDIIKISISDQIIFEENDSSSTFISTNDLS